ncbi:DNA-binding transcriptional regulator, LysR family [Rhizobiales bacterium GAS113]|jgi:DNA-binding transcriptional LysR family regulator|nr:DNA-binding transcriptional regulator, LysR family [Rhizobiales bacterium GAS113]
MDRDLLGHLPVVLAVARKGGFAPAALALNMSPSAVSHAVRLVETRLGTPLFARTTRSVALTEAGAALIETISPALSQIAESLDRLQAARGRVMGLLRLNAPRLALPMVLTRLLSQMGRRYPELRIEVFVDDALSDVVAGGFDAGVRLGEMIAKDMVAVRLTPPFEAIIVAAPSYLAEKGKPRSIGELSRHNCIGYRLIQSGGLYRWELREGGCDVAVEVAGTTIVNDALQARELALAGIGLCYIFEPLVRADIRAGRLEQVLPKAAMSEPGLFLYFPRGASAAPKLKALIDTARQMLRSGKAAEGAVPPPRNNL